MTDALAAMERMAAEREGLQRGALGVRSVDENRIRGGMRGGNRTPRENTLRGRVEVLLAERPWMTANEIIAALSCNRHTLKGVLIRPEYRHRPRREGPWVGYEYALREGSK